MQFLISKALALLLLATAIGNAAAAVPTVDQDGFELAMRFGTNSQFTFCSAYWTDRILLDIDDPIATKDADGKFASYVNTIATKIKGCLPGGCKVYQLPTPMTLLELFTNTPIGSSQNIHFSAFPNSVEALEWEGITGQSAVIVQKGWWDSGINYYDDVSWCPSKVRFGGLFNNEASISTVNDAVGFGATECGHEAVGAGAALWHKHRYPSTGTIWVKPAADQTPRVMPAQPPAAAPSTVCPVSFTSAPTIAPSSQAPSQAPTPVPTLNSRDILFARWGMAEPNVTYNSTGNTFTFDYPNASSTQIDMQEEFYDINCKDDGSGYPEYVIRNYFTDPSDPTKKPKMTINPITNRPELMFKIDTQAMANDTKIYGVVDNLCMGQYYDITATITVGANTSGIIDNYWNQGKDFPFTFEVKRKSDGSSVYSSGPIKVEWYIGTLPVYFGLYTVTKPIPNLCRETDYEFVFTHEPGNHDFLPSVTVSSNSPGTTHTFNTHLDPTLGPDQPLPNPNLEGDNADEIMFTNAITSGDYSFSEDIFRQLNPENLVTDLTGKEGLGMMKFCVRGGLGYDKPDATYNMTDSLPPLASVIANGYQEVNFIESLITIFYNLTSGFVLEAFGVDPKERVETTASKDAYSLEAWLCDVNSNSMNTTIFTDYDVTKVVPIEIDSGYKASAAPADQLFFNQGALITVCVAPDDASWKDGIRMDGINEFDWLRSDNPIGASINQNAITGGTQNPNGLTSYIPADCEGGEAYCTISSILFADFYISTGVVSGSGSANLAFGAIGSRRLGAPEDTEVRRKLQEDEAAASPFDISIPVEITDTGPAALRTAAGVSFTTRAATLAMGALLGANLLA